MHLMRAARRIWCAGWCKSISRCPPMLIRGLTFSCRGFNSCRKTAPQPTNHPWGRPSRSSKPLRFASPQTPYPRGGSAFAEERYYSISVVAATGEAPLVPGGPHQLACNGCIVETGRRRTSAEGARTGAAPFASRNRVTLKISQDSEMSVYSNGESHSKFVSPVWWAAKSDKMRQSRMPKETMTWPIYGCQVSGARIDI